MLLLATDCADASRLGLEPTGRWRDRSSQEADATLSGSTAALHLFMQVPEPNRKTGTGLDMQGRHIQSGVEVSGNIQVYESRRAALVF